MIRSVENAPGAVSAAATGTVRTVPVEGRRS